MKQERWGGGLWVWIKLIYFQSQKIVSEKSHMVDILGFENHVASISTTQLCWKQSDKT